MATSRQILIEIEAAMQDCPASPQEAMARIGALIAKHGNGPTFEGLVLAYLIQSKHLESVKLRLKEQEQ